MKHEVPSLFFPISLVPSLATFLTISYVLPHPLKTCYYMLAPYIPVVDEHLQHPMDDEMLHHLPEDEGSLEAGNGEQGTCDKAS